MSLYIFYLKDPCNDHDSLIRMEKEVALSLSLVQCKLYLEGKFNMMEADFQQFLYAILSYHFQKKINISGVGYDIHFI